MICDMHYVFSDLSILKQLTIAPEVVDSFTALVAAFLR